MLEFLSHGHDGARSSHEGEHVDSEPHFVSPEDPGYECSGETIESHECAVDGPFAAHDTGIPMSLLVFELFSG